MAKNGNQNIAFFIRNLLAFYYVYYDVVFMVVTIFCRDVFLCKNTIIVETEVQAGALELNDVGVDSIADAITLETQKVVFTMFLNEDTTCHSQKHVIFCIFSTVLILLVILTKIMSDKLLSFMPTPFLKSSRIPYIDHLKTFFFGALLVI